MALPGSLVDQYNMWVTEPFFFFGHWTHIKHKDFNNDSNHKSPDRLKDKGVGNGIGIWGTVSEVMLKLFS